MEIVPSVSKKHLFCVITLKVNTWVLNLSHFLFVEFVWLSDWELSARICDSFDHIENGWRHLFSSKEVLEQSINSG